MAIPSVGRAGGPNAIDQTTALLLGTGFALATTRMRRAFKHIRRLSDMQLLKMVPTSEPENWQTELRGVVLRAPVAVYTYSSRAAPIMTT